MREIKFVDICSGIGGFHQALSDLGHHCVWYCEKDKYALDTYRANHETDNLAYSEDLTQVCPSHIPDHDILCAGFPCQPYSGAGFKKGFNDPRDLFSSIADIIDIKRPPMVLLENVRGLLNHNQGTTFKHIVDKLVGLGYTVYHKVIKACDMGLPQLRPRLYLVCIAGDTGSGYSFPEKTTLMYTMSDVLGGYCPRDIGYTLRVGGTGSRIDGKHNWDGYLVDGNLVRLSPEQGLRMMGFPSTFRFPCSKTQAMKQLGNSVAVPVIRTIAESMITYYTENQDNQDNQGE